MELSSNWFQSMQHLRHSTLSTSASSHAIAESNEKRTGEQSIEIVVPGSAACAFF